MIRDRSSSDSSSPPDGVVSRVRQFLGMIVGHLMVSKGNVLVGRQNGSGFAEEITIGTGFSMTGGVISTYDFSPGGNGSSDSGKVAMFGSSGELNASWFRSIDDSGCYIRMYSSGSNPGVIETRNSSGTLGYCIIGSALGGYRTYQVPNASGFLALTPRSDGGLFGSTVPSSLGIATTGSSTEAARADHVHPSPTTISGKTITLGGSFLTSSAITFSCSGSVAFVGPTSGVTITLPSTSAVLARTDASQTFAGVQTFSSVPVFSALTRTSVYLNAAQTLTVSTYDTVKFDTVEFGSGFNTGTNTYTVPYTGYLKVTGVIGVNVCSGGLFVVTVYNGSTRVKRCFSSNNYMSGSINPFSVIIPVTAADSITIRVYSSPAAQLFNNSSDTWCQFEMLPN